MSPELQLFFAIASLIGSFVLPMAMIFFSRDELRDIIKKSAGWLVANIGLFVMGIGLLVSVLAGGNASTSKSSASVSTRYSLGKPINVSVRRNGRIRLNSWYWLKGKCVYKGVFVAAPASDPIFGKVTPHIEERPIPTTYPMRSHCRTSRIAMRSVYYRAGSRPGVDKFEVQVAPPAGKYGWRIPVTVRVY
ncbi:MAG: hypothetical protein MRY74_12880 [Neomegalonema sp.]|nr:hypothetical protein [Neomegalonema sp.]